YGCNQQSTGADKSRQRFKEANRIKHMLQYIAKPDEVMQRAFCHLLLEYGEEVTLLHIIRAARVHGLNASPAEIQSLYLPAHGFEARQGKTLAATDIQKTARG